MGNFSMWERVAALAVAIGGYGLVAAMIAGWEATGDQTRDNAVLLFASSLAAAASVVFFVQRRSRPLGHAFDLGYEMGRRDALAAVARSAGNVTPFMRKRQREAMVSLADRLGGGGA